MAACRACLEPESESRPFVALGCKCAGDMAAMHEDCAGRWFKKRARTCEVCSGGVTMDIPDDPAAAQEVPVHKPRILRNACVLCLACVLCIGFAPTVALLYVGV